MPSVLNTNIASTWASKNLSTSQSTMATTVERLSSGLRINRARDDAAGLAISNTLTSQINGANQGIRNLGDGISMVQTAEGALNVATEMAQRILTLATQGANATLSNASRDAIKSEMQQLITGINSISARTTFAGKALLDQTNTATGALFALQVTTNIADTLTLDAAAFKNIGASATTYTVQGANNTGILAVGAANAVTNTTVYLKINGNYVARTLESTTNAAADAVTFKLDGEVWAKANFADLFNASAGASGVATALSTDIGNAAYTSASYNTIQTSATAYLNSLNTQRSLLGAYQNQMEYMVSNVTELSSNLVAAKSRVIDTDYAAETANLTKGQILQQAATAMLAQANQMPNVILSLLK
jgi:flagellin